MDLSSCDRCNKKLGTDDCVLLTSTDKTVSVHVDCFRCFNCNRLLTSAGYVFCYGLAYCRSCYVSQFQAICVDCGGAIRHGQTRDEAAEFIWAMGELYHKKCFVCTKCTGPISGKFFVTAIGSVFCKEHPPEGTTQEQIEWVNFHKTKANEKVH